MENDEMIRLWTKERLSLRKIAQIADMTATGVKKRLNKLGIETSKASLWTELKCEECGGTFKRVRCQSDSKYCSSECYFKKLRKSNYKPNRHGQRIAREKVSAHFELKRGNVVHHVDGNNMNNKIHNLWVFHSQADHLRWHRLGESAGVVPIWKGNRPKGNHS